VPLDAMRCSLGALGILYAVTVQGFPATNFRVQNLVMPLDQAIAQIDQVVAAHYGVEMFWFPYTPNATFRTIDPSPDPVTYGTLQKAWAEFEQVFLEGIFGSIGLVIITRFAPSLTPLFTRLCSAAMGPCDWVMSPIDAFHYQYYYPKVWDSEFAVPLDKSRDAWTSYVGLVNEFASRQLYPINMVVHSRFSSADTTWLSPEFNRDSCYIESVTAKATPGIQEFYEAAQRRMMDEFRGRPHWAKVWYDMDRVRRCYEEPLRRFEAVRAKQDPHGVFLNAFLEQLLQPFMAKEEHAGTADGAPARTTSSLPPPA
jgi:L-gulonolactone oxidase